MTNIVKIICITIRTGVDALQIASKKFMQKQSEETDRLTGNKIVVVTKIIYN